MLTGSCLCGSVAYEVNGPIGPIALCHCQTCRKTHGSAFSAAAPVAASTFRFTRGEELLNQYESSPGKFRKFCSRCGSHIVAARPAQGYVLLRLGCLDTEIEERPRAHIWRSDAANWYDPKAQIPELEEGSPPARTA
jgi:hypothetical protein